MSSANINPRWVAPTPKKPVRSGATPAMRTPTQSSRSSRVRETSSTPYREPVPQAPPRPSVDSVTPFPSPESVTQQEEIVEQPRATAGGATETTESTSVSAPAPTMRISRDDAKKMIVVAIICDIFLPIGAIASIIIFFIWFKIKGVDLINGKKQFVNVFGNVIGEAMTAGIWAGVTVGVIITILFSWAEDKTGVDPLATAKLLKGKTGGIPGGPTPST